MTVSFEIIVWLFMAGLVNNLVYAEIHCSDF